MSTTNDPDDVSTQAERQLAYCVLSIAWRRFGCAPDAMSEAQRHDARQTALRQMLIEDAVLRSPEAEGVVIPESLVLDAVAEIKQRFNAEDGRQDSVSMAQVLAGSDLDEQDLAAALRRQLRVECVMERASASLPEVEDTEVRLFYYMRLRELRTPEARTVRHILVTINEDFPENSRAAAHARLTEIAARLTRKKARFADQALKHSECPSALNGGLLGAVTRGQLFPALDECLFGMAVGELSDIVESGLGFHLLLCEGITPARTPPIDEIFMELKQKLITRQRAGFQKRWLRELLSPATAEPMLPDRRSIHE